MITRAQVLAYRAAVSGLSAPGSVLASGVQDHPTGMTARLATALRRDGSRAVLVHSVRAATHLHDPADLGLLAAALRIDDGADLARQAIGPFGAEIGARFGAALDTVSAVMREVMADGAARTKGELSGAVSPHVPAELAPWCAGCGVHHVQDALFRYATLQAGLVIEVESPKLFRFVRGPTDAASVRWEADEARAELVRRFVHAAGPVRPVHLAAWLSLTPAAAKRWWAHAADDLAEVEVDGRGGLVLAADAASFDDPPPPDELRLLGPYDPLTELADREFLLPDAGERREVWAAAANPGIVLWDGEIAGTWRRRTERGRLILTARAFGALPPGWTETDSVRADADVIRRFFGGEEVRIETTA